jgi:hypothetical protein
MRVMRVMRVVRACSSSRTPFFPSPHLRIPSEHAGRTPAKAGGHVRRSPVPGGRKKGRTSERRESPFGCVHISTSTLHAHLHAFFLCKCKHVCSTCMPRNLECTF